MIYKIKKGNHYACPTIDRLWPFSPSKITGIIEFDTNCLIKGEISGWNKLTGFSSFRIHQDSARLVWMADGLFIKIAAYVYEDGNRKIKPIGRFQPNIPIWFSMQIKNGYCVFKVDDYTDVVTVNKPNILFKCFPFFGGQSTAPADMEIKIDLL